MKKSFFIPVLIVTSIVFGFGLICTFAGTMLGSDPLRAVANIYKLPFVNQLPNKQNITPLPYGNDNSYYYSDPYGYDSDIFDIFEEFGFGDEFEHFFSPYGGTHEYTPDDPVVIY